jgi:hypothetical protein
VSPDEVIVGVFERVKGALSLAEIVTGSGLEEIDVVDALPRLLRAHVIEPDPARTAGLRFVLSPGSWVSSPRQPPTYERRSALERRSGTDRRKSGVRWAGQDDQRKGPERRQAERRQAA